jgi:membrane-bound inhibitor of C-type lysozyme
MRGYLTFAALLIVGLSGLQARASEIVHTFRCEDGATFEAAFENSTNSAFVIFQGRLHHLHQLRSGSGIRYAGDDAEFWEHQGKVDLEVGGSLRTCAGG